MKLDTSSWYMCSIVVVALPCIVRVGGDEAADSEDGQWEVFKGGKKDNQEDTVKKAINPWEKYQNLFQTKRAAQLEAVKSIIEFDYEKQYKMISIITEQIFTVMHKARLQLIESGFTPGDAFPENTTIVEALSNIAENTAFFGDLILYSPDITHKIFDKNQEWRILIGWSVGFCNETNVYDEKNQRLLNLMAQELNLVEKDPNYTNPYKLKNKVKKQTGDVKDQKKKDKKKKDKKRGPRITNRIEL